VSRPPNDLELATQITKLMRLSRRLNEPGTEMDLFLLLSDIESAAHSAQYRMNDLLCGKGYAPRGADGNVKITLEDYLQGRDTLYPPEYTSEIRLNSSNTVDAVNELLYRLEASKVTFGEEPDHRLYRLLRLETATDQFSHQERSRKVKPHDREGLRPIRP
jgi:hypothetical protein